MAHQTAPTPSVIGTVSAYAAGLESAAATQLDCATDTATRADESARRHAIAASEETERAAALRSVASAGGGLLSRTRNRHRARQASRSAARHRREAARDQSTASAAAEAAEAAAVEAGRLHAGVSAEKKVVDALRRTPGVTSVVCGLDLGPGIGDIDVTAIGPTAIVTIEVKAGGGDLAVTADGVTHGGRATPRNPITQASDQVAFMQSACDRPVTGVVCFPSANHSAVFGRQSGIYLVGGIEPLMKVVSELLTPGPDHDQADTRSTYTPQYLVIDVNVALDTRCDEVSAWIEDAVRKNEIAKANIARWRAKLSSWSTWTGPQASNAKANCTALIEANLAHIARRKEKITAWRSHLSEIRKTMESNRDIVR